jgi:hypothetical protein
LHHDGGNGIFPGKTEILEFGSLVESITLARAKKKNFKVPADVVNPAPFLPTRGFMELSFWGKVPMGLIYVLCGTKQQITKGKDIPEDPVQVPLISEQEINQNFIADQD